MVPIRCCFLGHKLQTLSPQPGGGAASWAPLLFPLWGFWLLTGLKYMTELKSRAGLRLIDAQIQGDKLLLPVRADRMLGLVSLESKEQRKIEKGMTRQQRNNWGIGCLIWNSMWQWNEIEWSKFEATINRMLWWNKFGERRVRWLRLWAFISSQRRVRQGRGGNGLSCTEGSMRCMTNQQAGSHSEQLCNSCFVYCLCALLPLWVD